MKRVLEVVYGFDYGGIRAFIMNYLTYLDKDKFSVDIYAFGCESSPFTEQVESLGYHIYFQPENNVRNIPKFVTELKYFMIEHGPYDVVHAHNNLISAWVLLAAKLAKVPIRLSHSHTTGHFSNSFIQNIYSYFRRFLINILATKKLACGQLAGEVMYGKSAHFEIVANGISLDKFMSADEQYIAKLKDEFRIPPGVKVYANVTRMDISKNHPFLIDVFREIHSLDPSAILIYGGVTPDIAPTIKEVEKKIKDYGLEDYCRYIGPLMNIEQLYHLTDLWIYCSTYEGLPFGPLELQAASIPVIASDVISKEIDLGLGLVHFLSLNDSPKKWAELAHVTEKHTISSSIVKDAFQKRHFDIQQSVKSLENIYIGTGN